MSKEPYTITNKRDVAIYVKAYTEPIDFYPSGFFQTATDIEFDITAFRDKYTAIPPGTTKEVGIGKEKFVSIMTRDGYIYRDQEIVRKSKETHTIVNNTGTTAYIRLHSGGLMGGVDHKKSKWFKSVSDMEFNVSVFNDNYVAVQDGETLNISTAKGDYLSAMTREAYICKTFQMQKEYTVLLCSDRSVKTFKSKRGFTSDLLAQFEAMKMENIHVV